MLDYWRTVFNRNSLDGNGLRILSYVHAGVNWENASWVGGTNNLMQYGDGGVQFRPLTSLDVCAHEFGHGICQFTANLVYQGESGALNEGFSDIWGASIEHWAAPAKQTWLIGEEITLNAPALRSMQNPNAFNQPDTYSGTLWANTSGNDNGGVHTNSGVLNYWYFLISQGGNGTNDIRNTFTVNALGIDHAQRIAFRAESVYLTSNANFAAARTATIQAARDLYGIGSCDEIAVTNAWFAVGVGGQYSSSTTPVINGPASICYNSVATYTLSNVAAGSNVTWSASNSYITITPSADGLSATVKNISTTSIPASISVTINGCAGQLSSSLLIALGTPYITGTYTNTFDNSSNQLGYYPGITNSACTSYYINTRMSITGVSAGVPNVNWSKVSSTSTVNFTQTGNDISFYLSTSNQNVVYKLTAQNACGTTTNQFAWKSSQCSTGGSGGCFAYTVSPNPAGGEVNIDAPTILPPCTIVGLSADQDIRNLLITEVRIYDATQTLKKYEKNNGTKHFKVNLGNLKNGVYYLEIISNNSYRENQIIYKR